MPLDPAVRAFLDAFAGANVPQPWEFETPAEARRVFAGLLPPTPRPIEVGRVEERLVSTGAGDVPVRLFTPAGAGPFPVLVWFHGGGWVLGSLDEADPTCRSLCRQADVIVVCPDYRLAPEHRFPAAVDDCFAATEWVVRRGASFGADPSRIAVGGESAGGNLAAAVALMARDRGAPDLAFQLLVYPVVGLPTDGRRSYSEFEDGYFLTRVAMEWFTEQYVASEEDTASPYLAPLKASSLADLPPALVITAECDPIRDESEAYAQRLQESGVECVLIRHDGQIHTFFGLPGQFESAVLAQAEAASGLRNAFARSEAGRSVVSEA